MNFTKKLNDRHSAGNFFFSLDNDMSIFCNNKKPIRITVKIYTMLVNGIVPQINTNHLEVSPCTRCKSKYYYFESVTK